MRDRVFAGRDVPEALAEASRALGVPPETLRYVILDQGRGAGRGISPTPARVAVLLDSHAPVPARTEAAAPPDEVGRVRHALEAVSDAAGLDLSVSVTQDEDALRVRLGGPGGDFFLEQDGRVFRAVEHLMQRAFGRPPLRRLVLECEAYREKRDAALRALALALAQTVLSDGVPRTTEPLNAYERRVVHVAVSALPGLQTFSVGEGGDRRVTIAPDAGDVRD